MRPPAVAKLGALLILVTSAFFFGRASVDRESAPDQRDPGDPEKVRRSPLSAIPAKETAPRGGTSAAKLPPDGVPQKSLQDRTNAESVSHILAAASGELDDFWALSEIVVTWMKSDPDAAIAWLAGGENREQVLHSLFAIWSEDDLEAANTWLSANPTLDGYGFAAAGLAYGLVEDDQQEAALALAEGIDDHLARSQIWNEAGAGLYAAAPEETLERLAASSLPDELQRLIARRWETNLRNRSKRNAQNLASVYSSAVAAGAEFQGKSASEVAAELTEGINGSGQFDTTTFKVADMAEAEIAWTLENLSFEGGQLRYAPPQEDDDR